MKLIHVTKNNSKVYRLKDNRIGVIYDSGYVRVSRKLSKKYNDYKFQMKFLYQINKKVEVYENCNCKFPYNVRVLIEKECERFKHLQNFENKNC
tara:strand:- start:192 stop:473 length:282 start_codon:yes stop_codon:yes gene_type:complete